ncbi:uncharacterized protein IWZ02DRAFT_442513 [Phyllosticta citriasiana]|uniref:uncharacterized protein n=1 Tax=Phyllosticta citriasiana TaxID=595635 RepID=UPI0030FDD1D0
MYTYVTVKILSVACMPACLPACLSVCLSVFGTHIPRSLFHFPCSLLSCWGEAHLGKEGRYVDEMTGRQASRGKRGM